MNQKLYPKQLVVTYLPYILWPIVWALIVLSVSYVVMSHDKLAVPIHNWRLAFQANSAVAGLILVATLLIPSIRGGLRNLVIGSNSNKPGAISGLTAVWIMLIALLWSDLFQPARPMLFYYLSGIFLLPAVILGLSRLFIKPYKLVSGSLASDEPIAFRRQLAADQIIILDNLIELLTNQQKIRSIGLYGDWGTGKTSVYSVARSEIDANDRHLIWVEVDPWRYTSQEALVLGFYEEIGKALERKIPGIQNSAATLLESAEPLVRTSDKTGLFVTIFSWFQQVAHQQTKDPADYIENLLRREGKRLIVCIDNLERVFDEQQVLRTLQLVHFLQGPVTYVFLSEKDKLLRSMPPQETGGAATYLEKFIEYELELFKPTTEQLTGYFNYRLEAVERESGQAINLDIPPDLIKDFSTYRGVIKIFNQFTFDLFKRFYADDHFTVRLEDKLALDHIRLKYPILWRHIEVERYMYVGGAGRDMLEYYLMDEDEREKRHGQAINKVIDEAVPETKRETVRDMIRELFPVTNHLLGRSSKKYKDYENWQREYMVASPAVLDDYFAGSMKQSAYEEQIKRVKDLLKDLSSAAEAEYINHFREYLGKISEENKRDEVRLLVGEIKHRFAADVKGPAYLRALLRAYCKYVDYNKYVNSNGDGLLATMIYAIDETVRRGDRRDEDQAKLLDYIFSEIEDYVSGPSIMLTMLLYMLPERDNHYFAIARWGEGYTKLRRRGLKYVDNYYLSDGSSNVLFDTSQGYEWRFIVYQWALSVRTSNGQPVFYGAKSRFKRVNEYIFNLWHSDHRLAYDCIKQDFWGKSWPHEDKEMWHVNSEKLTPYDPAKMVKLADELTRSTALSKPRKAEMLVFQQKLYAATSNDVQS